MPIVEFAGMPKSGKTTTLEIVRHEIRRRGQLTIDYHGGGRYAPIDKSNLAHLNLFLAAEAVRFLSVGAAVPVAPSTIHLMDRGIFDRVIFTEALVSRGVMSRAEADTLCQFLLLPTLTATIDYVFIFVTSPRLSIERELHNKLNRVNGRIMSEESITNLRDAALESIRKYGQKMKRMMQIDTEAMDGSPTDTARKIVAALEAVNCVGVGK